MSEDGSPKQPLKRAGVKSRNTTNGASGNGSSGSKDPFATGYDFLLINSDLLDPVWPQVMDRVQRYGRNSKVVVVLVTYGGQANVAYRIARFLQTVYDEDVVAFIPAECKSAGTLLVTAAKSVVISPFGEMGPLDVQLLRRDEIAGRRSGLTTRSALEDLKTHSFELFQHFMYEIIQRSGTAVSFRTAADVASRMSGRLLSTIYEQINPDALGQDYRDLNIALKYGERLNRKWGNLKGAALNRLIYDYPSHDFVIDLEEAEELFQRVELPSPTLVSLMKGRAQDCLIPRTGKNKIIEMLTSDGKTLPVEERREEPARKRPDDITPSVEKRGDGSGTSRAP